MRTKSPKRAKLEREVNPKRAAYVKEFFTCQCCGKRQATDCHEILRGVYREKAIQYRACWLAVCRKCHDELGDASVWPVAKQLALKLLNDPEHFDMKIIQDIRDDHLIEMADVVTFLRMRDA